MIVVNLSCVCLSVVSAGIYLFCLSQVFCVSDGHSWHSQLATVPNVIR